MTQSGILQQQLYQQQVPFKLDTGAEVKAISHTMYKKLSNVKLERSSRSLATYVLGQFTGTLSTKICFFNNSAVKNLSSKLVGLPVILAFSLIVRVAEVIEDYSSVIQKKCPKMITGLGIMQGSTLLNYR